MSDYIRDLDELIEYLEDIRDSNEGKTIKVRAAFQPSYPLSATVDGVALERKGDDLTLWIAVGATVPYNERPYAPSAAWGGEEFGDE